MMFTHGNNTKRCLHVLRSSAKLAKFDRGGGGGVAEERGRGGVAEVHSKKGCAQR